MTGFTPIWALGLMSGTSLDGVDAAMVMTDGERILGFGDSTYRAYTKAEADSLRRALGTWPDSESNVQQDALRVVQDVHAEVAAGFPDAEVIGFHGQTLNHAPDEGRSFQLGDGAELAQRLDKTVVWDMRSNDIRHGGQGAPLVPFFHFALAKQLGMRSPVAFVNLGGVGNVTFVDPSKGAPENSGALIAFDTGPANAPINDLMRQHFSTEFDAGGTVATSGTVDGSVLEALFQHPYFEKPAPKSLDRDGFSEFRMALASMPAEHAVATATAAASACVYAAQMHFPTDPHRWLICGGGRKNPAIMAHLKQSLIQPVDACEAVGFDGDMMEAQAFGFLAVRALRKLPLTAPMTTGCTAPISGGAVSEP